MADFTKAFVPIMLDAEITIQISRSDYSRIVASGEDATYNYNGVEYDVYYDMDNDRYYFMIGDDMYIIEY